MFDQPSIPSGTDSPALEKAARNYGKDPVWDLLAKDAKAYPVKEDPWFAVRTTAMALQTPQRGGLFSGISFRIRWWMPIPLGGVAALALLLHLGAPATSPTALTSNTSENVFEQHMEMLASSDSVDSRYQ